jgi:hypothetical protein
MYCCLDGLDGKSTRVQQQGLVLVPKLLLHDSILHVQIKQLLLFKLDEVVK